MEKAESNVGYLCWQFQWSPDKTKDLSLVYSKPPASYSKKWKPLEIFSSIWLADLYGKVTENLYNTYIFPVFYLIDLTQDTSVSSILQNTIFPGFYDNQNNIPEPTSCV